MIRGMTAHLHYTWLHDRPCSIQSFYLGGWDEGVLPLSTNEITHLGRVARLVYSAADHKLTVRPERILTAAGRTAWRARINDRLDHTLKLLHAAADACSALPGEVGYSPLTQTYFQVRKRTEWGEVGLEKYRPTPLEALAAQDRMLARLIRLHVRAQLLRNLRSRITKCALTLGYKTTAAASS